MDKVIISKGYNSLTGECSSELDTPPVSQIIDGVDVSGCNNIDEWKHCNICQVLIKTIPNRHQCLTERDLRCEFYPDCYYKQLQRLKAENEELKKQVKNNETAYQVELGTYNMECGNLLEENKTLIAENERLKSIVESNNQQVEQAELLVMDNDRLQQEVENLKDTIYYDVEKYRQALQEIREIAVSEYIKPLSDKDCIECDRKFNEILAKINEVIGVG